MLTQLSSSSRYRNCFIVCIPGIFSASDTSFCKRSCEPTLVATPPEGAASWQWYAHVVDLKHVAMHEVNEVGVTAVEVTDRD